MAPSVKKEVPQSVAPLGPSIVDDDFYMATFRGGKVQKVINMMGGPPRRVRRVLDFDSKVEIEKEEALARKRKELGSGSEFEVPTGKKEKTLAEFLREMKKRKCGGGVASVQRKKLITSKKLNSVKKAVPVKNVVLVKEVVPLEEVVSINDAASTEEVVLLDEEIYTEDVVSMEETIPVQEVVPVGVSPLRKKRKRRSTSLLHTYSKLLDPPSEPQGDDETLAEFMKKSVSTTGRASSDNAGIKVFQRRKVKFKAVRRRDSKIEDTQLSSILVCDDMCECEVCGPLSSVAPKTVEYPTTDSRASAAVSVLTSCSASTVSDDFPEDGNLEGPSTNGTEQLSHPDSCMGEFDTLTLSDDLHQLPLRQNPPIDDTNDIQELTEEQFRVEVAQQVPLNSEVAALGSDFSCSASTVSQWPGNLVVEKYDEYLGASNDGPELCNSDMTEVIDATSRPQLLETSGTKGDVGQGPCAFNTESSNFSFASSLNLYGNTRPVPDNTASAVSPMELDLAVERIESILETLVTPDDLLPIHLSASKSSASKSTRKKKKRRRFSESVSFDLVTMGGSDLGVVSLDNLRIPQRQEDDLAEPSPLVALTPVTENVLSSVSDITEEVALSATSESSGILGQQISEQVSEQISEQVSGQIAQQVSEQIPEQVSEQFPEQVSEQIPEQVSEQIPEQVSEQVSGEILKQISEQISGQILEQISELLFQELGPVLEPTSSLLSEGKDTPAACLVDVEVVLPESQEDTVINSKEYTSNGSNSLVLLNDAVEVVGTPTKSTSCNEGTGMCQTASTGLDAAEKDEGVGGTSTSKALFSNLTDGFSKRNRKSFSPKSQKAFLEACRPERPTPPYKVKLMKSKISDRCSNTLFSQEMVKEKPYFEKQYPTIDDSSSQGMLLCDVEQIQLVASPDLRPLSPPPQTSDDTPSMSAPSPFGTLSECNTHVVPGSPEFKKEPYVSRQNVADPVSIYSPDNSASTLPCTEGSLHINVECHPETPSDSNTPNKNIEPCSQKPKSILKTSRSDTCRGVCECPRCVSKCNESKTVRKFIISQMRLADLVAGRLLDEMRNMRRLVEDASSPCAEGEAATSASNISSEKAKGALESATKTEDWAQKEILKMSRDSKRVCRLIEEVPRKTIFADDAGHRLCQVRLLPATKTLSKESSLPAKNL